MRPPAVGVVVLAFLDHAPFYSHGCLGCGWREGKGKRLHPHFGGSLSLSFSFFLFRVWMSLDLRGFVNGGTRGAIGGHICPAWGAGVRPAVCSEQYRRLWHATCLRPGVLTASVGCEQPQSIYAQQGKSHDFSGADDAYGSGRAPPPPGTCACGPFIIPDPCRVMLRC